MYYRKIASRLRLGTALAVPVAIAALAFAGSASAASSTPPTVVFTPTTGPQLETDVTAADAEPAGTLSIIEIGPNTYSIPNPSGTAAMTLDGNIEITGNPTYTTFGGLCGCVGDAANEGTDPQVNGDNITTPSDMFVVGAGANVLFKAFDIEGAGAYNAGFGAVHVESGATAEFDNMGLDGELGPAVITDAATTTLPGGVTTITNSIIGDSANPNGQIFNNSATPTTLINDTIEDNAGSALSGPNFVAINTLWSGNEGPMCSAALESPSTNNVGTTEGFNNVCGPTVAVSTDSAIDLQGSTFYGGPTVADQILAPSSAIGAGDVAFCPSTDQRFYPRAAGTCDVGSYQSTGDVDATTGPTQTTGPTCPTSVSVNESGNPATETVGVADSGIGLGPDAIAYVANAVGPFPTASEATPTDNGTVSYPTVGSTWFAATNPGATLAAQDDLPSTSPLSVTASKPAGDTTANDTHWSFDATNWLGITTYCH